VARTHGDLISERALGYVGLFLIGLIGWTARWERLGRVVVWLVTAIGRAVDGSAARQRARHSEEELNGQTL
jgi:hypothetical protein